MSETRLDGSGRVLVFASVVEAGTGLALLIDPALVVRLLVGAELAGAGQLVGRCFGIALFALGLACWPRPAATAAFRAMLVYNALIALYLGELGTIGHMRGLLLWPAVILHAAVALALVGIGAKTRKMKT